MYVFYMHQLADLVKYNHKWFVYMHWEYEIREETL